MTKVGQLFEDEKNRAVEEAIAKVTEKVKKEIAENALKQGFSVEVIAEILDLPNEKVLEIRDNLCATVCLARDEKTSCPTAPPRPIKFPVD